MADRAHDCNADGTLAGAAGGAIAGLSAQGFFDGSPVPTFVIDAEHTVTHFNLACARILGVRSEDVIGTRRLGQIIYGHERPVLADLIVDGSLGAHLEQHYQDTCRASATIPGAYEAQAYFPALGAQGLWLLFTAAPLRDAGGGVVGAIETLQDVTERKRAEEKLLAAQATLSEKLAKAQDRLVQSEKLSSIGQLAAGVAHEINNPIGYIFSNFGTLEKYLASLFEMLAAYEAAEASHAVPLTVAGLRHLREQIELEFLKEDIPALMRESKEGIDRVRKIVQDLKDFSHVDANPKWQLADLAQGIDTTLNVVSNEIKYKADVVKQYGVLPEVWCLAPELNQVVMNLVVNAAHAIGPERGTITIRTGAEGSNVWFEVADTGSGITKENLARIFDPFYTTKPVGKGTGLGLSLSYGIVQKHHGRIDVSTEVGAGTTFRVTLPVEQPDIEVDSLSAQP